MPAPQRLRGIAVLIAITVLSFCSIKKMAINKVANILTAPGGGKVFTADNDPELVGDALPFAIKMYESLLASAPYHRGLQLQTGSLYIMYANAFLQTPAAMLPEREYQQQEFLLQRAKNLYLRGRDMLLSGLDRRHPGFRKALENRHFDQACQGMGRDEVPFLYWSGAGWIAAFAIDPFDMDLGLSLPEAAALMERVLKLEPTFDSGAIHDFYVLYYGSLPDYMGGDLKKAREHFEKAISATGGRLTSPYLSLATTVTVKEQNAQEFKELLEKVLAIDAQGTEDNRLLNIINQRKARWFLDHIADFFVDLDVPAEEGEPKEKSQ